MTDSYEEFIKIDPDTPVDVVQSLCMHCNDEGETRLMPTNVPYFKDIVLSSFNCPHCGYKDTDIIFAGKIASHGVKITVNVVNELQLNRFVVKSEHATIKIPEIDLEIPAKTQKGSIKTLEGYLRTTYDGLKMH